MIGKPLSVAANLVLILGCFRVAGAQVHPTDSQSNLVSAPTAALPPALADAVQSQIGFLYNGGFPLEESFLMLPQGNRELAAGRLETYGAFLIEAVLADPQLRDHYGSALQKSVGDKSFRKLSAVAARADRSQKVRAMLDRFHEAAMLHPGFIEGRLAELFGERAGGAADEIGVAGSFRSGHRSGLKPAEKRGKEELYHDLISRLNFVSHGNPAEKPMLEEIIKKTLESPTARAEAARFLDTLGSARPDIGFYPLPGVLGGEGDKREIIAGILGQVEFADDGRNIQTIKLNQLYLQTKQLPKMVDTFAHEVLGHGAANAEFTAAKLSPAFSRWIYDELGARIVGWVAELEAGGKAVDPEYWAYRDNPEGFINTLESTNALYAALLTREEMRDPVAAYRKRLFFVKVRRQRLLSQAKLNVYLHAVLTRFEKRGELEDADSRRLRQELDQNRKALMLGLDNARETEGLLSGMIENHPLFGPAALRDARRRQYNLARRHPLFRRVENRLERYVSRLKKLLRNRNPETEISTERPETETLTEQKKRPTFSDLYRKYRAEVDADPAAKIELDLSDPEAALRAL